MYGLETIKAMNEAPRPVLVTPCEADELADIKELCAALRSDRISPLDAAQRNRVADYLDAAYGVED